MTTRRSSYRGISWPRGARRIRDDAIATLDNVQRGLFEINQELEPAMRDLQTISARLDQIGQTELSRQLAQAMFILQGRRTEIVTHALHIVRTAGDLKKARPEGEEDDA